MRICRQKDIPDSQQDVLIFSLRERVNVPLEIIRSALWIEIDFEDYSCAVEYYVDLIYKCALIGKRISVATSLYAAAFPPEEQGAKMALSDQTIFQSISNIAIPLIQQGEDRVVAMNRAGEIVTRISQLAISFEQQSGSNSQIVFNTISQITLPLIFRDKKTIDEAIQISKDMISEMIAMAKIISGE